MEKQSVFEHLAEKFSKCGAYIGEKVETEPIEEVMRDAGNSLYDAISSGRIWFDLTPMWLKREPKGVRILGDPYGQPAEVEVYGWSLYWVFAANYLYRNKCGHRDEPRGIIFWADAERYLGGYFIQDYLIEINRIKVNSELWRQTWEGLITASKEVCSYLAQISKDAAETDVPSGKAGDEKSAEPEQNNNSPKLCRRILSCLKKIPKGVYILVIFLAALLSVFYYIGWLEPMKEFIKNIFQPK